MKTVMFTMQKIKLILLLTVILFSADTITGTSVYGWRNLGNNGTNGSVNAITQFNGRIIAAGKFTNAGGVNVNNIAAWDPNTLVWSALGSGLNDTVYSLYVYNSQLYAAGRFTQSGAVPVSRIAMWNGTAWQALGSGLNGEGYAIFQFGSDLIVAGDFTNAGGVSANNIASWNGISWSALGSGISGQNKSVYALAVYDGNLIAAGKFSSAGGNDANNIAKWNGSTWSALGQGTDGNIFTLTVYSGNLVIGGDFEHAGGNDAVNIAKWNGSSWSSIGQPHIFDDNSVNALTVFDDDLIAGGGFRHAGNLYVDRVARYDGSSWKRMQTGMNNRVKTLYASGSDLYSGGLFSTAGGRYCSRVARWINEQLVSVSGRVRYADNNQNVQSGSVKIFRIDINTRELIILDSSLIGNGQYSLINVPRDSNLIVVGFPDDEMDFVPTIYPSAIDWRNAVFIHTYSSHVNVNISVYRITPQIILPLAATIGGNVFLNIDPQLNPPPQRDYPFLSGAIVYIKQGILFRRFAVSNTDESYLSGLLNPGIYDVFVSRPGYTTASRNFQLVVSLDTMNFYLDTLNIIGLHNITTAVPKEYQLNQNYPNPFNPVTTIQFSLPRGGFAVLKVYDILGRETAVLVNEFLETGEYKYIYDAQHLSSGLYFYSLTVENSDKGFSQTKKMILIK